MKLIISIKLKAAFFLVVFALNTILAFACSLGLDMGYNSEHHNKDTTIAVIHTHSAGNKHVHLQKIATHGQDKSHSHAEVNHTKEPKEDKNNCCKEKAKEFQEIDKLTPGLVSINYPGFFAAFDAIYRTITFLPFTNVVRDIKPFVRNNHPPIPDIRIAIGSFQI